MHVWGRSVLGGWPAAPACGTASRPAPPAPATQFGQTPLHMAAHWGHKDVAALLLERGAYKEAKDRVSGPRIGVGRGRMESDRPGNKALFTQVRCGYVGSRKYEGSTQVCIGCPPLLPHPFLPLRPIDPSGIVGGFTLVWAGVVSPKCGGGSHLPSPLASGCVWRVSAGWVARCPCGRVPPHALPCLPLQLRMG